PKTSIQLVQMRLSLRNRIQLLIAGTVMGASALIVTALALLARTEIEKGVQSDLRKFGGVLSELQRERASAIMDQCILLSTRPGVRDGIAARSTGVARAAAIDCIR